jgi:hypothetical protein
MRMLTYFINRGGKGLSAARRRELERAKKLLRARMEKAKARQKKKAAWSVCVDEDIPAEKGGLNPEVPNREQIPDTGFQRRNESGEIGYGKSARQVDNVRISPG